MLVHIFRGPDRIFAVTPDPQGEKLPDKFAPWSPIKSVDMHKDEPQGGVDVNVCLDDIAEHGFHLTDAHVRIDPSTL